MAGYSNIKPISRPQGIPARLLQSARSGYGLGKPIKPAPVSLSLREAVSSRPTGAATSTEPAPFGLSPTAAALTASSRGQIDIAGLLQALRSAQAPRVQPMGAGGPAGGSLGPYGANTADIKAPAGGSASGYITRLAQHLGVDPAAARAVASVEGGLNFGGPVGDQGTSGGPYQLHRGGALPSGRSVGWAATPQGVAYALQEIARIARGLHGRAAVEAIVRRFERPANPGAEVLKAWGRYGRV